jgi:hypothetical protein
MEENLSSEVNYIYAYGMFGSMQSKPFEIDVVDGKSVITITGACNAFLTNDEEAKLKVKYF